MPLALDTTHPLIHKPKPLVPNPIEPPPPLSFFVHSASSFQLASFEFAANNTAAALVLQASAKALNQNGNTASSVQIFSEALVLILFVCLFAAAGLLCM